MLVPFSSTSSSFLLGAAGAAAAGGEVTTAGADATGADAGAYGTGGGAAGASTTGGDAGTAGTAGGGPTGVTGSAAGGADGSGVCAAPGEAASRARTAGKNLRQLRMGIVGLIPRSREHGRRTAARSRMARDMPKAQRPRRAPATPASADLSASTTPQSPAREAASGPVDGRSGRLFRRCFVRDRTLATARLLPQQQFARSNSRVRGNRTVWFTLGRRAQPSPTASVFHG